MDRSYADTNPPRLRGELPRLPRRAAHRRAGADLRHRLPSEGGQLPLHPRRRLAPVRACARRHRGGRELAAPDAIVAFDDFRAEHCPGVAAAVWGAVATMELKLICITGTKAYGTWGDPEPVREELVEWLATRTDLWHGVEEVAGAPLIRIGGKKAKAPTPPQPLRPAPAGEPDASEATGAPGTPEGPGPPGRRRGARGGAARPGPRRPRPGLRKRRPRRPRRSDPREPPGCRGRCAVNCRAVPGVAPWARRPGPPCTARRAQLTGGRNCRMPAPRWAEWFDHHAHPLLLPEQVRPRAEEQERVVGRESDRREHQQLRRHQQAEPAQERFQF